MKTYVFTYLNSEHKIKSSSFESAYIELVQMVGALDAGNYNCKTIN